MLKQTSPNELDAMALMDAQRLVERGWCQNALQKGGSFCALGAINQATSGCANKLFPSDRSGVWEAFTTAIGSLNIAIWNNAPERTQAEVVEAFCRATEIARAKVSA